MLELAGGQRSTHFYAEGLAFPDASFPGLVSLHLSLLDTSNPVGRGSGGCQALPSWGGGFPRPRGLAALTAPSCPTRPPTPPQELPQSLLFQDSVVFRVAPWIMTPNTQPPKEVYVCR